MTTVTLSQNIDLWEAWVDAQTTDNSQSATIIVIGDVMVNNQILVPRFVKCVPAPGMESRLVLEIVPNVLCEEGTEIEITYAEQLASIKQYTGVTIYVAGEVMVEIDDLEIIY